jgi:hypothetical protein
MTMFWLFLAALYLLGAPITMFFLACFGLADFDDVTWADAHDIMLFVVLWPAALVAALVAVSALGGERLREWLRR